MRRKGVKRSAHLPKGPTSQHDRFSVVSCHVFQLGRINLPHRADRQPTALPTRPLGSLAPTSNDISAKTVIHNYSPMLHITPKKRDRHVGQFPNKPGKHKGQLSSAESKHTRTSDIHFRMHMTKASRSSGSWNAHSGSAAEEDVLRPPSLELGAPASWLGRAPFQS
jgi:hypothetical protein